MRTARPSFGAGLRLFRGPEHLSDRARADNDLFLCLDSTLLLRLRWRVDGPDRTLSNEATKVCFQLGQVAECPLDFKPLAVVRELMFNPVSLSWVFSERSTPGDSPG